MFGPRLRYSAGSFPIAEQPVPHGDTDLRLESNEFVVALTRTNPERVSG